MLPVIYSDYFLQHITGSYHPESPQRLMAIVEALKTVSWNEKIDWQLPSPLEQRDVLPWVGKLHSQEYINLFKTIVREGGHGLDIDTPVSAETYNVALLAVSAWLDGVDRVLENHSPAFVLARPPGHHAEKNQGMGFCFFSNAAIAAHYALENSQVDRVGILDWDVHHGNGTQYLTEDNPNIAFCSLHQFPCYPGTGRAEEKGKHDNVLNIPLPPGGMFKDYNHQFVERVIPFFREFQPDLLIVSAGYDANHADRLAGMSLFPQDYGVFTDHILEITSKILFGLEGGYDLKALAESVLATLGECVKVIQ